MWSMTPTDLNKNFSRKWVKNKQLYIHICMVDPLKKSVHCFLIVPCIDGFVPKFIYFLNLISYMVFTSLFYFQFGAGGQMSL